MPDTPKRLVGPMTLTTSAATVYTVPAGTTTIVRDILVFNTTVGLVLTLSIGADAGNTRIIQTQITQTGLWQASVWIVLSAGETLQAYTNGASAMNLLINGVEIT